MKAIIDLIYFIKMIIFLLILLLFYQIKSQSVRIEILQLILMIKRISI